MMGIIPKREIVFKRMVLFIWGGERRPAIVKEEKGRGGGLFEKNILEVRVQGSSGGRGRGEMHLCMYSLSLYLSLL